ncbi:MAG TPA: hypothetical protein PLZ86_02595 [bacterium]|nr:hypothetical protein [bacterium]
MRIVSKRASAFQAACSRRGVGIVAVLLIVSVLSVMGLVVTALVATGAVARTNDLVREQAFELGTAGIEYALKRISEGADPNGDVRYLGAGRFTVGYAPSGLVTVTSDVSSMLGSSTPSFTVQGPTPGGNMADCLEVDVSGAYMNSVWWPYEIMGAVLQNTCNVPITISTMTISWSPTSADNTVRVRLGNSNVYNNWPGTPAGSPIDITDYTIPECSSADQTRIRFDTELPGRNFTIEYAMSDGSSKSAFYQFVANNEAACLSVDLSTAYVGWSGFVRLVGGELTNVCDPPTVIGLRGMTVEWEPLTPSRNFTGANFDGNWRWSGSVSSGTRVDFWGDLLFDPGQSVEQRFLQFDSDIRGRNFTVTYHMRDGTDVTATKNLYEPDAEGCLQANTGGTTIGGGANRELQGETLTNTCALGIVVDRIRTSWTGLPANRRLDRITMNGANVWSGSAENNVEVDINDVEIPGGGTIPVDRYRWNSSVAGVSTISHAITLTDGTVVNVPAFSP